MLNILFIGDINGKIGRQAVAKILPNLKKSKKIDLVIANADNVAHGSGVTSSTLQELLESGVDFFTNGDHAFRKLKQLEVYQKYPIIRPANFSTEAPGEGFKIIKIGKYNVLIVNLIGRVFMKSDYNCPFHKIDEILAKLSLPAKKLSAILVDIHAEATSEKVSLGHYIDGKVSAIFGTHTHIMTADHKITNQGTAYITDAGMTGSSEGSLGIAKEGIIKTFLTQIKYPHEIPETGQVIFNSVLVKINPKTKKAVSIKPITKYTIIK